MAASTSRRKSPVRAVSDTPAKISLNLDTLEREVGEVREPYVVLLGGQRLEFTDPQEIAWQDLMNLDDPEEFAHQTLQSPEERSKFLETKLETWKMQKLMRGFRDHYGLGELGNDGA